MNQYISYVKSVPKSGVRIAGLIIYCTLHLNVAHADKGCFEKYEQSGGVYTLKDVPEDTSGTEVSDCKLIPFFGDPDDCTPHWYRKTVKCRNMIYYNWGYCIIDVTTRLYCKAPDHLRYIQRAWN